MGKTKLFILNTLVLILSSLLIKIISSSFDIYLANIIGAETLGIYSLVISIYMFFVTIATSGINLAITKIISEEVEKKEEKNIPIIVKKTIVYTLIFGMLSLTILVILAPYICRTWLMNKVKPYVLYTLALSLPFLSLTSAINGYFLALRKVVKTSIVSVSMQLIRIYIIWMLVLRIFEANLNMSVLAIVIASTTCEILSFLFLYVLYIKDKKNSKPNKPLSNGSQFTKRLLKISLPIAITSYIRSGLHTLKHVLIPIRLKLSGMSYEKAISNYGIITGMALPIIFFPTVIVYSYSSLLIPEFSRLSVEFNKEKMNKDISKLFEITLYFSIFITGIFMAFGKQLGNVLYNTSGVRMVYKNYCTVNSSNVFR